ncbi:hypothetical protein BC792_115101 [Sphingobacterium allocomposti]|uniref:Uncharacterized protein n=1 Tax=Sphingobacterium allocomposti TaxID=415956 RepID=A0A5S5DEG7_9SPHI|nr:hypothetical protein BC792_115101 [Sphingobacterium composti Yoo et al. 2007 non Ten et al. 2007]
MLNLNCIHELVTPGLFFSDNEAIRFITCVCFRVPKSSLPPLIHTPVRFEYIRMVSSA